MWMHWFLSLEKKDERSKNTAGLYALKHQKEKKNNMKEIKGYWNEIKWTRK